MTSGLIVIALTVSSVGCDRKVQTQQPSPSPIPWKTIEPPQRNLPPATPSQSKREPIKTFSGTGVVVLVNLKEGWIEINHDDIAGVMPAMQMEWFVKDKSMLNSIQAGEKVDFTIEDNNGSQVITRIVRK